MTANFVFVALGGFGLGFSLASFTWTARFYELRRAVDNALKTLSKETT